MYAVVWVPVLRLYHDRNGGISGVHFMIVIKLGWLHWVSKLAVIFLGMIFIVAGVGKLLATNSLESFLLPASIQFPFAQVVFGILPYLEIAIGALLVSGIAVRFAATVSLVLAVAFMVVNIIMVSSGLGTVLCGGCFGVAGKLSTYAALTMDIIMAVLSLNILFCYRGRFFNLVPWYLETGHNAEGRAFTQCAEGIE